MCGLYLLIRCDGNSEDFDSMVLGFISSLLHTSTWLFVTSNRMAISHYYNVLVLVIVGTPACKHTHKQKLKNDITALINYHAKVFVCVIILPSEQISDTFLDGTVSVRALANVFDAVNGLFEGIAMSSYVS